MRCLLLFFGVLASSVRPDDRLQACQADPGVVLLQKPSVSYSQVTLGDQDLRQSFSRLSEHPAPHFGGALANLTELTPLLEHEAFSVLLEYESFSLGEVASFSFAAWNRWTPRKHIHSPQSVHIFLSSVVFFDWCLFVSAIMVFLLLHMLVLGRMADNGYHAAVLLVWLAVGLTYNAVIWGRFGSNAGISWFAGYLLEIIFLVENIFIFHIVIQAFKTPIRLTTKALHIVVWCQIMFEMIFFMGLAAWLRSFKVLPYILGVWLICCGFLAGKGEPHEIDIMDSSACRAFTSCLGDRLSPSYEKDGCCLLRDRDGKMRVSLLALVVFTLLIADFLLEIDVVLTKVEEIPNPYIAFTSSALAAFSIPELFFVSKGLLKRFVMLKYGIGFVLVLFGAQMLLSSVYILRPIVACCIIVIVLAACVVISIFLAYCPPGGASETDADASGMAESTTEVLSDGSAENTDAPDKEEEKGRGCTKI